MSISKFIRRIFNKTQPENKAPFVIINKDSEVIEFDSIESAIAELEKDPDIPSYKIKKIRDSFEEFKNKGKIKIKNGEIIN